MAAPRFLAWLSGRFKQVAAIATSAGAGDADKIPATGAGGYLDPSLLNAAETGNSKVVMTKSDGTLDSSIMPSGIGADTATVTTSEDLASGDLVNIYDNAGTATARKADADAEGKECHGFVLAASTSGNNATVYFEGKITGLSGKTPGARQYMSTTAGQLTESCPSTSGNVAQCVGVAVSATVVSFEAQEPVTVA